MRLLFLLPLLLFEPLYPFDPYLGIMSTRYRTVQGM